MIKNILRNIPMGGAMVLVLSVLFLPVMSQTNPLDIRISGTYSEVSLKTVLTDITIKSGVEFSYSASKINAETIVSLSYTDMTLSEVLDQLFEGLPVRYELMDGYVILKKGQVKQGKEEVKEGKITLNGFIRDNKTGEYLIGATLYIRELGLGAVTNNYGYFSITLPPGRYTLELSYIGYEPLVQALDFNSNMKIDFKLVSALQVMDEVVITSVEKEELLFKKIASQSEVIPEQIMKQPSLFGESDILKSLELQPGIFYFSDGSSYFSVRGGHYDQNLILLDDATLFNPSHLLGIFSPIIPDAIKSVDIYKSGFPAKYGGRLSSVIDIRTRDGNMNKFSATGSLGIISGRLSLEGPFRKGRSSYFLSFRRSYFDRLLKRAMPDLEGLYFSDFTSKFNFRPGPRDRLFITLYKGQDVFRQKQGSDKLNGLDWSNTSLTIRWNHIFGSDIFLNTTLYGSKYDYYLHSDFSENSYWNSRINNSTLKEELTWYIAPNLTLRYGFQFGFYDFNPGNYSTASSREEYQVSPVNSLEAVFFIAADHELFPWLALNYGIRGSRWMNFGEAFVVQYDEEYSPESVIYYDARERFYSRTGAEPRFALSARIGKSVYLKSSYSRTLQYLNLISNSISPFNSFEVWLPAGPNIEPQYADIVDLGLLRSRGEKGLTFQTSLYYKWMYNQIGYDYHANMMVNPLIEGELRQGKGWAYGLEISLQKENDKFKGQLAYTWSHSYLKIDQLNGGNSYPATQDRPHVLNISFSYQAGPRWLLTGTLNYASGARITTPASFYYYQGYQVPVFTGQNNDRLPPYRRVDMATTFRLNRTPGSFEHSITFAIYNFFAVQNPIFLYFNKTLDEDGKLVVPADRTRDYELTPSIRYTFIFFPSLTYQFSF